MSIKALIEAGKDGKGWYRRAGEKIAMVCKAGGWDVEGFTAVLAITSPRVHVKRNWALTLHYAQEGTLEGMACLGVVKAAVAKWEEDGVVRGPKVNAFYRALLGDEDAVVVDTWMMKAYGMDPSKAPTVGQRRKIEASVLRAAKRHGMSAADTQACIWLGAMRQAGRVSGFEL